MFVSALVRRARLAAAFALAMILAVTAYGFAATNTVNKSAAGDGNAAISGYNVTNITYTLRNADPTKLDAVTFTVTPSDAAASAATDVRALISPGTWVDCTSAGGNWTCDFSAQDLSTASVSNLQVVAAQ